MYTTLKEAGASKNKEEKGQALHGKTGQRNEKFTEIEIHTVLKHIKKRCANSLIQKKMQKKMTLRRHCLSIRFSVIKSYNICINKVVGNQALFFINIGNAE